MKVIQKITPKLPIYIFFIFKILYIYTYNGFITMFLQAQVRDCIYHYTHMCKKIHKVTACRRLHKKAKIKFCIISLEGK